MLKDTNKPLHSAKPHLPLHALLLASLPLLLQACAGNSTLPEVALPEQMPPPALTTPPPPAPYSQNASQDIEAWQKRLTDTRLMQQP